MIKFSAEHTIAKYKTNKYEWPIDMQSSNAYNGSHV